MCYIVCLIKARVIRLVGICVFVSEQNVQIWKPIVPRGGVSLGLSRGIDRTNLTLENSSIICQDRYFTLLCNHNIVYCTVHVKKRVTLMRIICM